MSGDEAEPMELTVTRDMQKEAIKFKQHFTADSYKEKADLHVTELKIKKALEQVLTGKTSGHLSVQRRSRGIENAPDKEKFRAASLSFKALLEELDEGHLDFVHTLAQSPGLNETQKKQLYDIYNDNFTMKLNKQNMPTDMMEQAEECKY